VRIRKDLYAWIVVAATLAGAAWLYTYRVWNIIGYVEYSGQSRYRFHPTGHARMQPWWSVYAAVALMLIGAAVVVRLLPEQKRKGLIRRFVKIISPVSSR
jgi:H+/Cl- antiporter ClcA